MKIHINPVLDKYSIWLRTDQKNPIKVNHLILSSITNQYIAAVTKLDLSRN